MMERLGLDNEASDEGCLERGPGACKVSARDSRVEAWSEGRALVVEEGGGPSVLVLLTGLREKKDFFGDFEI